MKVEAIRSQTFALRLMEGRKAPPKQADPTELSCGGKIGAFWQNCKRKRRCERLPYARLLANPVLAADYRTTPTRSKHTVMSPENKIQTVRI